MRQQGRKLSEVLKATSELRLRYAGEVPASGSAYHALLFAHLA